MSLLRKTLELSIQEEHCTRCGKCEAVCPGKVFQVKDAAINLVKPGHCIACGHCVAVCRDRAFIHSAVPLEKLAPTEGGDAWSQESIHQLFMNRRSVRNFQRERPSNDLITKLVEYARFAPTSTNSHNVRFYVFTEPAKIGQLKEGTADYYLSLARRLKNPLIRSLMGLTVGRRLVQAYRYRIGGIQELFEKTLSGEDRLFYQAPAVVVLAASGIGHIASSNCNLAASQMLLGAQSLGLGGFYNGFLTTALVRRPSFSRQMGIPSHETPGASIALGIPAVQYHAAPPRPGQRIIWNPDR